VESGRPEEALKQYRVAEQLDPSSAVVQHHLGHPYFVKRQFEQALHYYQTSLDMESRQAKAHYCKGRVFEEMGKFEEAIEEFQSQEQAAEQFTDDRKLFFGKLRDAVRQNGGEGYWRKRLDLALKESHQQPYEIATLYARLGDKQNAYAWLKKACAQKAFTEGLLFDLCWDHNDEQFKAIARGIGLLQ